MADLFVSYSREDKPRAAEIVRLLEDHGWDVFWDQETRAGTLWPKVLEDELNSARCLVALWTTTSIASRWVRIEAYEALQTEKLVPVLLDKVRPPLEFRQTQMFDLVGWNGDRDDPRLANLLADLTVLVKAPVSNGGAQRAVKIEVPPTLQRELSASTLPGTLGTADRATGRRDQLIPVRGVMLGVGVTAAVGAIAWLLGATDPSPEPTPALTPLPAPQISVAPPLPTPAPVQPAPADLPPIKTTTLATGPSSVSQGSKAVPRQMQKLRSWRCLAIEEKFQQTGQITVAERDLLRGKECQS